MKKLILKPEVLAKFKKPALLTLITLAGIQFLFHAIDAVAKSS